MGAAYPPKIVAKTLVEVPVTVVRE